MAVLWFLIGFLFAIGAMIAGLWLFRLGVLSEREKSNETETDNVKEEK